jgi:hypothetical protein
MPELNEELSFLLTSAREAAAAGKNLNIDPGYVLEALEVMQAARTAIGEMQTAHESQLTRMAKERARIQRKVDRLTAELEAAQRSPLGYAVVEVAGELSATVPAFATLEQANTAEGIIAGHDPDGGEFVVCALREVQP